ncbi:MAG: helix-turn-helix domain-containing protein [Lachnospiraceae bacterium]|nr:helix-turn-helix domain-containing protein [Lachnospiraceae bacterium]
MFTERNEDQLITIEQLCEQLFISPTTAYKLLRTGEIKAFKLGTWKISSESVKTYIKNKCG